MVLVFIVLCVMTSLVVVVLTVIGATGVGGDCVSVCGVVCVLVLGSADSGGSVVLGAVSLFGVDVIVVSFEVFSELWEERGV